MAALPKKNPKLLARIVEMFSGGYSIAHIARAESSRGRGEDLVGGERCGRERHLENSVEQRARREEARRTPKRSSSRLCRSGDNANEPESIALIRARLTQFGR